MYKQDVIPGKVYMNEHTGAIWIAIRETDDKKGDAICIHEGQEKACKYGRLGKLRWGHFVPCLGIFPLTVGFPRLVIRNARGTNPCIILFIDNETGVVLRHGARKIGEVSADWIKVDKVKNDGTRYWKDIEQ